MSKHLFKPLFHPLFNPVFKTDEEIESQRSRKEIEKFRNNRKPGDDYYANMNPRVQNKNK